MSLTKSLKELISNSLEYREVIENIPIHLSQFLKRFQDPEQRLKLNFDDLRGIKREYYKATNIKALGTIIAALVLSSAVVLFAEGRSVIAGYSLGTIQIALAGFLSIILIVLMLRKEAKI